MLPTIEQSEKFKTEVDNFNKKIESITNENIKTELTGLLRKLIHEVRLIDTQHQELFYGKKLSSTVSDNRQRILEIRKKLVKRISDRDAAQRPQ